MKFKTLVRKNAFYLAHRFGVGEERLIWAWDRISTHNVFSGVDDAFGTIFVKVPKTGSISTHDALFGASDHHPHYTAMQYRRSDPEKFVRYYKFAFVRDPAERLISAFSFFQNVTAHPDHLEFAKKMQFHRFSGIQDFVSAWRGPSFRAKTLANLHFRPQWHFVCDPHGQVLVDDVFRFDALADVVPQLQQKLGVDRPLKHKNKGGQPKRDLGDYLAPEDLELVRHVYARDYALLDAAKSAVM